jgi:hypothetical protein
MDNQEFNNPPKLLLALIDSFNQPMWIIDKIGNVLMNDKAKEYSKKGFDITVHSSDLSVGCTKLVTHFGKNFKLNKKDINHGTNSCLCTLESAEDPIQRLKDSSKRLQKALNTI